MKKIPIQYKVVALIVLTMATIGQLVRFVALPELTAMEHLRIFFASILALSIIVSFYFFVNNFLNKIYPYGKSFVVRIIIQLIIGLAFLYSLHGILFIIGVENLPLKAIANRVKPDRYHITAIFILDFFLCLAVNLSFFAEYLFNNWKKAFQRAERLEKEKAMVQYDNLKNQLNPHFLFNALTSLNSLIYENQDQASQFLKQLSKVYRYLLENKETVTLRKELEFLENYISLLKTRFRNALHISVEVEDSMKDHRLVPVTLQNLLENALKHNIVMADKPLHIRIYIENAYICVENTLQRKSIVENSNKQGLLNLKNLYRYLDSREVLVTENKEKFIVKVPLL